MRFKPKANGSIRHLGHMALALALTSVSCSDHKSGRSGPRYVLDTTDSTAAQDADASADSCAVQASTLASLPRRLSLTEYKNAIQDVLGIDIGAVVAELPPSEASHGFSNSFNPVGWSEHAVEQYQDAAFRVAEMAVMSRTFLPRIGAPDCRSDQACFRRIGERLYALLLREPMPASFVKRLDQIFAAAPQGDRFRVAVYGLLGYYLQHPKFLYRIEADLSPEPWRLANGYELASRLSFLLWQSGPDVALLKAAASGSLLTEEGYRAEVERMLASSKARRGLRNYVADWLSLANIDNAQRDGMAFPEFTAELKTEMKEEVMRSVVDTAFGGRSLMTLFMNDKTFLGPELAALYGLKPTGEAIEEYNLAGSKERTGLLSMPGIMTSLSASDKTSIVGRGLFFLSKFMCRDLPPPPPEAGAFDPKDRPPGELTARQLLEYHTRRKSCNACHGLIDPVGFALENYDSIGRYRTTYDGGVKIDASSSFAVDGKDVAFSTPAELAKIFSTHPLVRDCWVTNTVHFGLGMKPDQPMSCSVEQAKARFASSDMSYRALIEAVVESNAFLAVGMSRE